MGTIRWQCKREGEKAGAGEESEKRAVVCRENRTELVAVSWGLGGTDVRRDSDR